MPTPNKKSSTALMKAPDESVLALLRAEFPTEPSFQRALLPRLFVLNKDEREETKVNGKKEIKVITEAGTFIREKQETNPENGELVLNEDTGKPEWTKEELGDSIEGIIVFQRKQLRYYDEGTEQYTSSPVYDNEDEVLPLFCDKAEVDRGTPAELKAKYPGVTRAGKPKSNLEDNRILYVLVDGELHQMNLRGTSMFAYMDFARKARPAVPAVLTSFGSEHMEKGDIEWQKMTFTVSRPLSADEVNEVVEKVREIKDGIEQEKAFFADRNAVDNAFAAHQSTTDKK